MSKPPEFTLPQAPEDLCFTSSDFISPDFDVDNFLHEHRKLATLETMRDDLGVYLKILRSAMIELINKDYADFVNLSKDLIGLDKAIDHLECPLGQIREEVLQIRQTLDSATVEMSKALDENRRIQEEKQCMHSLGRVYKSLGKLRKILGQERSERDQHLQMDQQNQHLQHDQHQKHLQLDHKNLQHDQLDRLERGATEYNQLIFHSSRCQPYISKEIEIDCKELEDILMTSLSIQLLSLLQERSEVRDKLARCLRIYMSLDKIKEAEDLVRSKIVAPAIEDVVVEKNIYNEPLGLKGLYDKLLDVLKVQLTGVLVLESNLRSDTGRGFNFIVNSYWVEVEEKIELRLKSIFAAGNPNLFHQRYHESLQYLKNVESHCGTPKILQELRAHPLYLQFSKKWNLPVYFQIRFQEMAGGVEQVLSQPTSSITTKTPEKNPEKFTLNATQATWLALEKSWSEGIFLNQLLHQFWKLNLQIISRFRVWVSASLKMSFEKQEASGISSRLEFLVYLFSDVLKFEREISNLLDFAREKVGLDFASVEDVLKASLGEMRGLLIADLPGISGEIVEELLVKSLPSLKQVSDIPRLFRRTMRDRPTQPCGYVKGALQGLVEFKEVYRGVGEEVVDQWMLMAVSQLAEQYFLSVKDVLESVQKTEESLRRLKKIRDKSSGVSQPETQGISDDEKIRIQLEIDVHTFCDSVKSFNIDVSSITRLPELVEIVEAAVKAKS